MAHQRSDVEIKYDNLYGLLGATLAHEVANATTPAPETYARLKPYMAGVWATAVWAELQAEPPSLDAQLAHLRGYLEEKCVWTEHGVRKTGSRAAMFADYDRLISRTVLAYAQEADLVLDLGCGWGHRMVDLYLSGLDARFWGGDRSDNTRKIIGLLRRLFPAMRINGFKLDMLNPDFGAVPRDVRRVCVFSCHAIEQIAVLGPGLIDALCAQFAHVPLTAVHLEPVASQIDPARTSEAAYAAEHRYNSDLLAVLESHPGISVVHKQATIHDAGDRNPTALVVWTKR